jgi:hypothetical protein
VAGVVALLRVCGRGRCGWEPATLLLLACLPPVLTPLVDDYHPQDLVAMGLVLGALACVRRSRWFWAGLLIGLAVTSQQFALLVLLPLLVVAPGNRRPWFALAAVVAAAVVDLPIIAVTSGHGAGAVLIGSGNSTSFGGTVLWELRLKGAALVGLSRVAPIVLSMVLAWWARRRWGEAVCEPLPLMSLVATSLGLRIIFEQNLFGYYLMALSVALVILHVIRGRVPGYLMAWLALVTLEFNPVPYGFAYNATSYSLQLAGALRLAIMAAAVMVFAWDIAHRRIRPYLVAWLVVVAVAFVEWPPWKSVPLRTWAPLFFWQILLIAPGMVMAISPLVISHTGSDGVDQFGPVTAQIASDATPNRSE